MEARHAGAFDDTELRAEVEVRGIRGGDLSFYEILDVPATASSDAIKAAYDRLSLVFHPDRLRNIQDETLRAQAAELYDRIQTAYEVLRSGIERARYNRELRAGSPTSVTQSARPVSRQSLLSMEEWATDPAARRALKTAQQALTAKDQALAKLQLQFALAREPENALIRDKLAELDAGK
jgi:curved DNA-binding protein CbpA